MVRERAGEADSQISYGQVHRGLPGLKSAQARCHRWMQAGNGKSTRLSWLARYRLRGSMLGWPATTDTPEPERAALRARCLLRAQVEEQGRYGQARNAAAPDEVGGIKAANIRGVK